MSAATAQSELQWPALLQYRGDDELAYIADEADWLAHADMQHAPFTGQDRLIDSRGRVFYLRTAAAGGVTLHKADGAIDLPTFTTLLRAHAVVAGSCCAGKVGCNDLAEGMALIGLLEDD